ncbi:hypothetical protein AWZ03_013105 [Drosophila navojoa]|uniref:Uncharacterized protein n=1 Tax=Drosophila navojoa TaxID=7232 RepID=A0A484AUY9_DRONA|nr:hypothetical protein AWZ03_013105 [Drosophila navojoa]
MIEAFCGEPCGESRPAGGAEACQMMGTADGAVERDTGTALRFIAMRIELLAKCMAEIIQAATDELRLGATATSSAARVEHNHNHHNKSF